MKVFQFVLIGLVVLFGLLYLTNGEGRAKAKVCNERGVAYFKSVGMYPMLPGTDGKKGEWADDDITERCNRNPGAFGP